MSSAHLDEDQISRASAEQDYSDPNFSKKKKIIFWLYLLSLCAFIISIVTLISKAFKPIEQHLQSDNFYFSNQVVSQWNVGFVTDIKILKASINPNCPADYQHAFSYKWRGSGFGCLCISGQNTTFVLQAYCSPALIQSNCTNIQSQEQRQSNYWTNDSNICIKRSSVSFANEQKFDDTNKICGSSQSLVIVPSNEPCPLVNISTTLFSLEDHIYTAVDTDGILSKIYGTFNSTSPYSFYSYPVVKLAVSEDTFCQINEDTGVNDNHGDFVLLSYPRGCTRQGNYTTITSTTELDFYSNNPNLYSLTQIKGFPEAGNWEYKIGFSAVAGWTYRCRHNLNGKFSIAEASKQFNFDIYGFLQAGTYVIIACSIVIGIEIFILGLKRCINNSIYPVGYRKKSMPNHFWWSLPRYIVDLICKVLILIFSGLLTFNGFTDWHWYKQVQNNSCHHGSLDLVTYVIKPYQQIHFLLFEHSMAIFLISTVMLVIDIFHFHYVYNHELAHYFVEENRLLLSKNAQNKKETLDKLNDLKWLQVENVQELQPNKNDDQLRITMAQNLYAFEENESPIIRPKKGKKAPKAKKIFSKQIEKQKLDGNGADLLFNDDLFAIDNIDEPSITVLKAPAKAKKLNNRKKR